MFFLYAALVIAAILLITRASKLGHASNTFFQPGDRVLFVTSHPDDETMFFSPTILSLAYNKIPAFLLCLSNGDAYGKGQIREKELLAACERLRVPKAQITIVKDPRLKDGMKNHWPAEAVAEHVHEAVQEFKPNKIVTFDSRGVSGHINHIGAHGGVKHYMQDVQYIRYSRSMNVYMLETTGIFRKFSGLVDLPVSSLMLGKHSRLVMSPYPGVATRAMAHHRSQRTWYRHLFMLLSRYTMMNTLVMMDPVDN